MTYNACISFCSIFERHLAKSPQEAMRQVNVNMREVDEPWNICQLPQFIIKKKQENQLRPVEGVWKLVTTENMEEVVLDCDLVPKRDASDSDKVMHTFIS